MTNTRKRETYTDIRTIDVNEEIARLVRRVIEDTQLGIAGAVINEFGESDPVLRRRITEIVLNTYPYDNYLESIDEKTK
jgi:hypothetical protein